MSGPRDLSALAPDLFARHLDLTPLRGRSRGLVHCPFHSHQSRTPSLSVDLDRGVFHCFVCGAQGGVLAFAKRVGEDVGYGQAPALRPWRGLLHEARAIADVDLRRRAQRMKEEDVILGHACDWSRRRHQAVERVRVAATRAGDCPESWDALDIAARLATETANIDAEVDSIYGWA